MYLNCLLWEMADRISEIGERLESLRRDKNFTRETLLDAYFEKFGQRLHPMTLYRYEKRKLKVPEDVLRNLCELLGVAPGELDAQTVARRRLRIGLSSYPDSAFFCAVASFVQPALSGDIPDVDIEAVPVNYSDVLPKLRDGELDLALYNEERFYREQPDGQSDGEVRVLLSLSRFRGNALMANRSQHWKTFSQHYAENVKGYSKRRTRVAHALLATLVQLKDNGGRPMEILVPGQTDRCNALLALLDYALDDELEAADMAFLEEMRIQVKARSREQTGHHTLIEYDKRLKEHPLQPCLFFGGLSHRLFAEERGASALIDNDDLHVIASLNPAGLARKFFPTNVLLVSRDVVDNHADDLAAIREKWNRAVRSVIEFDSGFFRWINPLVDRTVTHAISTLYRDSPQLAWPEGQNLFERMILEELIQVFHWNYNPPQPARKG